MAKFHTRADAGRTCRVIPLLFSSCLLAAVASRAQPAPAAEEASEAVLEMSPFVVSAFEDDGYQAANTLAGSRMNTSLKDTPASLSILTAEFLQDIAAIDLTEAIAYGNNVEVDLTDGNQAFEFYNLFKIRGQAASVARNYFVWKLPTDTFNIERIEEARGPNSILFGIASAGGLLSSSTKQASTDRNFRKIQLMYGSYDMRRATIDINQTSLNGKLGVRFNGLLSETQGYQHYASGKDNRADIAIKYNLAPNFTIRGEYETGKAFKRPVDNQEIIDNSLLWYNSGQPTVGTTGTVTGVGRNGSGSNLSVNLVEDDQGNITNFDNRGQAFAQAVSSAVVLDPTLIDNVNYTVNVGGPSQTQESSFQAATVSLDYKLGQNTYFQLAFNHQDYDFDAWQATSSTGLKGDPNKFLRGGATANPNAGRFYFQTYWTERVRSERADNLRLTISHEFNFGKWGEYRLAGLAERDERNFYNIAYNEAWVNAATNGGAFATNPQASANRTLRWHYITPGDYESYYASAQHPDPATGAGFITGMVDPSNPARTLNTRMVVSNTSGFDDPTEQNSGLIAAQAYYFKRKLVIAGGYRTDKLFLHEGVRGLLDPVTSEPIIDNVNNPRNDRTLDAKTKTLGAVFHALPWLSLRYNQSDSIELPLSNVRIMPDDGIGSRVGDNPKGDGQDYGIDVNLMEGKIFLRATKFTTNRIGYQAFSPYGSTADNPTVLSNLIMGQLLTDGLVSATERALHQPNSGGCQLDLASSGYEFSATANPIRSLRLQANYSITDAVSSNVAPEILAWADREIPYFQTFDQGIVITSSGKTIATTIADWQAANAQNQSISGVAFAGNRREKVSGVATYTFNDGPLKGFHVTGTVRHQGKQVIANSTTGDLVYGNSFTRMDAAIGYRLNRLSFLPALKNVRLQLNVMNVLNQHDPLVTRVVNANVTPVAVNRLAPQLPISWRLTADLSF